MVGNYGVPSPTKLDKYGLKQAFESGSIHASALLVQVNARLCSSSGGTNSSISGGSSGKVDWIEAVAVAVEKETV